MQKPEPIQELLRGGKEEVNKNSFNRRRDNTKTESKCEGDAEHRESVSNVSRGG